LLSDDPIHIGQLDGITDAQTHQVRMHCKNDTRTDGVNDESQGCADLFDLDKRFVLVHFITPM
jgi:hypothetical protein